MILKINPRSLPNWTGWLFLYIPREKHYCYNVTLLLDRDIGNKITITSSQSNVPSFLHSNSKVASPAGQMCTRQYTHFFVLKLLGMQHEAEVICHESTHAQIEIKRKRAKDKCDLRQNLWNMLSNLYCFQRPQNVKQLIRCFYPVVLLCNISRYA